MQCNIIMTTVIITLTSLWPRCCLKSPASRLFTQLFIQTQIKENIKAPRHWPLCGEFTGTGEFPAQRASYAENVSIWWRHHDKKIYDGLSCAFLILLLLIYKPDRTLIKHSDTFHLDLYNIRAHFKPYWILLNEIALADTLWALSSKLNKQLVDCNIRQEIQTTWNSLFINEPPTSQLDLCVYHYKYCRTVSIYIRYSVVFIIYAFVSLFLSGFLLTHWGRDKMAAIFQTIYSNAFSWMKSFEFWLKFHWSLFLRV